MTLWSGDGRAPEHAPPDAVAGHDGPSWPDLAIASHAEVDEHPHRLLGGVGVPRPDRLDHREAQGDGFVVRRGGGPAGGRLQRDPDHRPDVGQERVVGGVGHGVVEVELGVLPGERFGGRGVDPALVGLDLGELLVGPARGGEPGRGGGDRRADLVQLAQVLGPLHVGELPARRCRRRGGATPAGVGPACRSSGRTSTSPFACSALIASRTTVRLTPSSAASSSSLGRCAPLAHAPLTMRNPSSFTTRPCRPRRGVPGPFTPSPRGASPQARCRYSDATSSTSSATDVSLTARSYVIRPCCSRLTRSQTSTIWA